MRSLEVTRLVVFVAAATVVMYAVFVLASASAPAVAGGTTYTVTNLDDPGDGTCNASCTLREAIDAANGGQGNTIAFSVPGCPPACTIVPGSALPAITQLGTRIDGTTQPGYDGFPLIVIDGTGLPAGTDGLTTTAEGSTFAGLWITNFPGHGIDASSPTRQFLTLDHVVSQINGADGLNAAVSSTLMVTGGVFFGNGASGIYASDSTVGSATFSGASASGNGFDGINVAVSGSLVVEDGEFSSNGASGVYAANSTATSVEVTDNTVQDNGFDGVKVAASGTLTVETNTLAGNVAAGLFAGSSTVANATLFGNSISDNGFDGANVAVSGTLNATGNLIYDNAAAGLYAGGTATASGVVAENGIGRNTGSGVVLNGGGVAVHHNHIAGNGAGVGNAGGGMLGAENNWWGCNEGPGQPGCDTTTGSVDADPWLVLELTVDPDTVAPGGTSTLTGSVIMNSDGLDVSAGGHLPNIVEIVFQTNSGLLAGITVPKVLMDGVATALFTASTSPGAVQVSVSLDNAVVLGQITVTEAASPTPTPTPSPTASPTGSPATVAWGDGNCSGSADPVDSLLTLRYDAGLSAETGTCPEMGEVVDVQGASLHPWGDVDCSGAVDPVDSLKLLRFDAGLSVQQGAGCPQMGAQVAIGP